MTASEEVRLHIDGLRKVYGMGTASEFEAIKRLDFDLHAGEFACIVGPSGSGKTTLLKCISGLLDPTEGEVVLNGKRVDGPPEGMAVVFQEYARSLFPWMTVEKNVELPLRVAGGLSAAEREERVAEALGAVGLEAARKKFPWQLSGGMQQRVAIARAVASRPSVLLMDEPFGALDAQTRVMMQENLLDIWDEFGTTVVFVTHDIDEAVFLADRVVVMSASPGRIIADIKVDLPRPREQSLLTHEHFIRLKRQCLDLIRQETLSAFQQQNRVG